MRLTRVHVEAPLSAGSTLLVEGSAANHIARVLRLRLGAALTVFDGRGGEYAARIEAFRKDAVSIAVVEQHAIERESPLSLTLVQGISRGERMDWVIQKATELGVTRIVPVFTERSVVRLDGSQAEKKRQHWRGIAVAACEQSGRNRVPEVTTPVTFYDFIGNTDATSTRLLLSPTARSRIHDLEDIGSGVTVLIGPEGGLADSEEQAALKAGFKPVRMGPRVLRTETAAVAALTILQRDFGDL